MSTTVKTPSQYVFGPNGSGDILHFTNQQGQIVSWIDGNGLGQGGLAGGLPQFGSYIISVTSGTVSARNNLTGNVDFSGTDAAVVINSTLATLSATGGRIFFERGTYTLTSVTQENTGGFTNFYCVGIPATNTSVGVEWYFNGESQFPFAGIAASQTQGVIFNVSAAALTSAGAGNLVTAFWQRPSSGQNNQVYFEDICVRWPDNQRGNEHSFNMAASIGCSFINCGTDFAGAWNTHIAPVAGTNGLIGFVTNRSSTNLAYLRNTVAEGFDIGYEIDTEHSHLIQTTAYQCNVPYGYGMVGTTIFHASEWFHPIEFNCISSLKLGPQLAKGSQLIIKAYDRETTTTGPFATTTGAVETNAGFTTGVIYKTTVQGLVGIINPNVWFAAGQGINIQVIDSGKRLTPGLVNTSTTSAATTGTIKQTLASYTIPDGPQGSDGSIFASGSAGNVLRIKAWGITAANGNSKTFTIDFGGTTIATVTSSANNGVVMLEANVISITNTTQEALGNGTDGTVNTVTRTAAAITGTAAITLAATATTPTASGDFTFKGWTVEYLGGAH